MSDKLKDILFTICIILTTGIALLSICVTIIGVFERDRIRYNAIKKLDSRFEKLSYKEYKTIRNDIVIKVEDTNE